MEIRYSISRDEVKEIIGNYVIDRYFANKIPPDMEMSVIVESYGEAKVDIYEKEVATAE